MKNLNIDVMVTEECNFRCKYCYEKEFGYNKKSLSLENCEKISNFIDYVLTTWEFQNAFGEIKLNFWGGEPTLNLNAIKHFVEKYKENKLIQFYFSSNGSEKIYDVIPLIQDINTNYSEEKNPRFKVQISYDGKITQDKKRIYLESKEPSSEMVKKQIQYFIDNKIFISLKSTLSFDDLNDIYENYKDIRDFFILNKEKLQSSFYNGSLNYSPTLDYKRSGFDNEIFNINEFQENLNKILKDDIEFYKIYKRNIFSLFSRNARATCVVGKTFFCIDSNLDIFPCHGALFSKFKNDYLWFNLNNNNNEINWKNIINNFKEYQKNSNIQSCNCFSNVCLNCNITKYDISNKNSFWERWNDFTCQPHLCDLYKEISKRQIIYQKFINKK